MFGKFVSGVIFLSIISAGLLKDTEPDEKDEKWKKKDVRDYTDADLERLYEQWEVMTPFIAHPNSTAV